MNNRVVDILTAIIQKGQASASRPEGIALAVIAALEKEGYKVVAREPTEAMVTKARLAMADALPGEELAAAILAAHDAAPRYGEPSG